MQLHQRLHGVYTTSHRRRCNHEVASKTTCARWGSAIEVDETFYKRYVPASVQRAHNAYTTSHRRRCDVVKRHVSARLYNLLMTYTRYRISPVVYSTDRFKAVVPVLVLLFVALWFILRGDLFYVLPCVILFLCFQSF